MALILETAEHPRQDRVALVREVIGRSGVPTRVGLNPGPRTAAMRMEAWQLGDAYVLRTDGTGMRLSRGERQVRLDGPEILVLSLCTGPRTTYTAHGRTQHLLRNELHLVDCTGAYDFSHVGATGGSLAAHFSYAHLGLPVDVVRRAVPRLPESPLLPLVRSHFLQLTNLPDSEAAGPAAASLGAATLSLAQALVVSAAGDRRERDVLHRTLRVRVESYMREHLSDPGLCAAQVAHAHHVSLRTLYNVWGNHEGTVMEWVMTRRLEGARRDLTVLAPGEATVATIARRWGFTDPAHFSRRFRAAFGSTPGEWRSARPPHG